MKCSKCKKQEAVWYPPTDKEILELWKYLQWQAKPLCDQCHSILRAEFIRIGWRINTNKS